MKLFTFIMTLILCVGCVPELEDIQPDPIPQLILNREFSQSLAYNAELPFPLKDLNQIGQELSTIEALKFLKHRLYISHYTRNEIEKAKTLAIIDQVFTSGLFFEEAKLADGKYIDAVLGFAYEDIEKEIHLVKSSLNKANELVPSKLDRLSRNYKWPSLSRFKLNQTSDYIFDYFDLIPKQLRAFGVYEPVVVEVEKELKSEEVRIRINSLNNRLTQLQRADSLGSSLVILDQIIEEFNIELSVQTIGDLQGAKNIAQSISQTKDSTSAFELIVRSWLSTSPVDREKVFSSQSKDLFEFLQNRSEEELHCYIPANNCAGPVRFFIRELAIIPEIEGYGVLNIRNQVDRAAADVLKDVVKEETLNFLKDIDSLVTEEIVVGIRSSFDQVDEVTRDPSGFVKDLVAESDLNTSIFYKFKEWIPNRLSLEDSFLAEVSPEDRIRSDLEIKIILFELIKMYIDTNESISISQSDALLLSFIEFTLELSGVERFDKSFINSSYSFVKTGNKIEYALDIGAIDKPVEIISKTYSADFWKLHGRLIRMLTSFMPYFQDWNKSIFDEGLGAVYIEDILQGFSVGELDQRLFPKDAIYAMVFANCVLLVKNLSYKGMGLFVADQKFNFLAYNDEDPRPEKQSAMSAIIDESSAGDQYAETKANTVLISALANLLSEAALIKNSGSDFLREALGGEELSSLEVILNDLELLTIAMSNFVSHYLQNSDGLVYSKLRKYDQRTFEFFEEDNNAGFYAIDSYVDIHNKTGVTTYKWSAQQAYEYLLGKSRLQSDMDLIDAYSLNRSYLKIKSIQKIKKSKNLN